MSIFRAILAASPRRLRQVAALVAVTACGGGGEGGPSGPDPAVTAVTVSPATVTFDVGATQQLTANVTAVGGAPTTVTWTSGDPTIVAVTLNVGGMITALAGLSFLGLGVQPPTSDWGSMLSSSRQYMNVAPHVAALPGLAIFLAVLGFNLLGDGLRDALDPRLR